MSGVSDCSIIYFLLFMHYIAGTSYLRSPPRTGNLLQHIDMIKYILVISSILKVKGASDHHYI